MDIIDGGPGDDLLTISDTSFLQISGGNGTDTLLLDGNELAFVNNSRVSGIEIIDMGSGSNTVTLSLSDVFTLPLEPGFNIDTTLRILGTAGDTVAFLDTFTPGSTQVVDDVAFNTFEGTFVVSNVDILLTVLIDQDITNVIGTV